MIDIRAATPDDAPAIAAIYAPYVLSGTVSFETEAPDTKLICSRMAASDGLYPWMVVTNGDPDGGGVIGYAYASKFRERPAYRYVVETSIYMAGPAQGQGAGRLLYGALMDTLRAQNFTQAIAVLSMPNDYLIRLHESVGFQRAGQYREIGYKQGRWVDVGFFQRELNTSCVPPVEPKRFADVGVVRVKV